MKKLTCFLLATLFLLLCACGDNTPASSEPGSRPADSITGSHHIHSTTGTSDTTAITSDTTVNDTNHTTTDSTSRITTTKAPTTTTKKPITIKPTTIKPTTTSPTATTTLPAGDYTAYNLLSAAAANTRALKGQRAPFQIYADQVTTDQNPDFSEGMFTYEVEDITDPAAGRFLTGFVAGTIMNGTRMDITQENGIGYICESLENYYQYAVKEPSAWATMMDGVTQSISNLPPKATMVDLTEKTENSFQYGFQNQPYYEVPVSNTDFATLYPEMMQFGATMASMDPAAVTALSVSNAKILYTTTYTGYLRRVIFLFNLHAKGSRQGTAFNEEWKLQIHIAATEPNQPVQVDPMNTWGSTHGVTFEKTEDPGYILFK